MRLTANRTQAHHRSAVGVTNSRCRRPTMGACVHKRSQPLVNKGSNGEGPNCDGACGDKSENDFG
eukprot:7379652-Prymnesium_polylepis.2